MKMLNSIKGKIGTAFIFLIALSVTFIAVYLFVYFNNFYMDNLEYQLKQKARMVAVSIEGNLNDRAGLQENIEHFKESTEDFRFTIIRKDGLVLAESETLPGNLDDHSNRPEVKEVLDGKTGINIRYSNTVEKELLYVAVPIIPAGQDELAAISRVSLPLEHIQKAQHNITLFIISAVLFAIFLAWGIGTIIARNISRPLDNLTKWSKQLARGNFTQEFPVRSNDEIGQLAHSFYEMKTNLSELMNSLTEEKNKLAVLLNNMPDGIIGVDNNKNITLINPAARDFLKIKGELLNKPLISVTRNYTLNNNLEKVLLEGTQIAQNIDIGNRALRVYITPIHGEDEQTIGAVVILQDVTDLTRLEQVRKEFISNISHELRTPLTSIQGFIETLQEEIPRENQHHQEFLEIIKGETQRFRRLIEDLTTLSRLETKPGAIQPVEGELITFLDRIISLAKERWQDKGYQIKAEFITPQVKVFMDKDKIQQALTNLIDNAAKHNPAGTSIILRAELTSERDFVKVSVVDNGIGIPEEELPRIFERFYRLEKSRYKEEMIENREGSYGGTGLGLSITKHILEAHNTNLEVESRPGEGTLFYFYLQRAY